MAEKTDEWDTPVQVPDEWDTPVGGAAAPIEQAQGASRLMMIPHALATGAGTVINAFAGGGLPRWKSKDINSKFQDTVNSPGTSINNALGLGMENHPELTPKNNLEKYGTAGIEALPNAGVILASGGTSAIPALITAEAGAMGAQKAKDAFPGNKWAPVIAGIVSSVGAGWATSAVTGWLSSRQSMKDLAQAELDLQAAKTAKVTGAQDAELAANQLRTASKQKLTAAKDVSKSIEDAAAGQTAQTYEQVAGGLGPSKTLEEAGKTLQDQAQNWVTKIFPEKMKAVSEPLDTAVAPTTLSPMKNFTGAYNAIDKKTLINRLDLPDALLENVKSSIDLGTPLMWSDARQLRTAIGDALARPKIINDIGEQNVKQLYAAATADLGKAAESVGAKDLFTAYNKESTRLHEIAAGPMSKIVSAAGNEMKETITPAQAAKALIAEGKNGGTELATLRGEIPTAVDNLAAMQLRSGSWSKLSPEARAALVPTPTHTDALTTAEQAEVLAGQKAKALVLDATKSHETDMETAKRAGIIAKHARTNAVTKAENALSLAAAKAPPPSSPAADLASTIRKWGAAGIGALEGPALLNQLGIHVSPEAGVAIGAATLGAPLVSQGARAVTHNPALLTIPMTGAMSGRNALAPDRAK